jgi:hypothetical protein
MGSVDNSRMHTTPIRNAGFVSFFTGHDCVGRRHPDYHDTRLRRQKRRKVVALLALAASVSWVAVESARAISLF